MTGIKIFTILGKKHSGSFMNTKSKTHYTFLLTGKGKQYFFQKGKENYVIDLEDVIL